MITLATGVVYDETQPIYKQSPEVLKLIADAMQVAPVSIITEECLGGSTRPTETHYALTDQYIIKEVRQYNSAPTSKEFLGLSNIITTIIPK